MCVCVCVCMFRRQRWSCPRWGVAGSADSPAGTAGLPHAPGCAWPRPAGGHGARAGLAEAWAGGGRPGGWREPSPSHPGRIHLLTAAGRENEKKEKVKCPLPFGVFVNTFFPLGLFAASFSVLPLIVKIKNDHRETGPEPAARGTLCVCMFDLKAMREISLSF